MIVGGVDDLDDIQEDVKDDDTMVALEDAAGGVHVDVSGDDFPVEQNTTTKDFSNLF